MSWKTMHLRGLWSVMSETSNGRTFVAGHENHCRGVYAERKLVPRVGRVEVVGAVLLDAEGGVVEAWGRPVDTEGGPHLFEPLTHLYEGQWSNCRECGQLRSVGQLLSDSRLCSSCTYQQDPFPRPVTFDEAEETIPHPGPCGKCSKGKKGQTKLGKRYVRELGQWLCDDCAVETRQSLNRARQGAEGGVHEEAHTGGPDGPRVPRPRDARPRGD